MGGWFFVSFFGASIRKFHTIFAQLHLTIECVKMDLNLERNNDGSFTQPFLITMRICSKHLYNKRALPTSEKWFLINQGRCTSSRKGDERLQAHNRQHLFL